MKKVFNTKKKFHRGLCALAIIPLIFFAFYLWAKSRLPNYEGRIEVKGIFDEIEVLRDSYAMPHIYAKHELDLYFALGYVVAQDRLLQMDLMRRAVLGRLSEVLGADFLKMDRFFRTLRGGQKFREVIKKLPAHIIQIYKAYALGVNHFMQNHSLPLEFSLLGYRPEAWDYADGMAAHYYMAWSLNSAFYTELACALFLERFASAKTRMLCPIKTPLMPNEAEIFSPASSSPSISRQNETALFSFLSADTQAREFFQVSQWGGSNSWIISPERSESGGALLANDMHLRFSLPGIWYEAHLVGPKQNISGVSLAGVPHIVVGANTHVAWAFTNASADDSDFYYETIDPQRPDYYLSGKRFVKMQIIKENIPVKGQEDIPLRIAITRHGPIINGIYEAKEFAFIKKNLKTSKQGKLIAMRWTAREHHLNSLALYQLNHAKSIQDVEKASQYFKAPGQNWIYGDRKGNIGYSLAACIPRRRGFDGFLPLEGAGGRYEWGPCLPLREQLRMRNPSRGWIASANEKHSSSYPYPISHYYAPPYRSMRIRELLSKKEKLSIEDFQRIQNDSKILIFEEWKPILVNLDQTDLSPFEKNALKELLEWDGFAHSKGEPAAAIFFAFWMRLLDNFFGTRMNEEERKIYYKLRYTLTLALRSLMQKEESKHFDDPRTPQKEGRDELLLKSFQEALVHLRENLGPKLKSWNWGELHQLTFYHALGRSSRILGYFLNRGPFPISGGNFSVNPTSFDFLKPYEAVWGASMRYIIDLKQPDNSLRILPTGLSGNFLSPYYDDQIKRFMEGKYRAFVFSRSEVIKEAKYRLFFVPSQN